MAVTPMSETWYKYLHPKYKKRKGETYLWSAEAPALEWAASSFESVAGSFLVLPCLGNTPKPLKQVSHPTKPLHFLFQDSRGGHITKKGPWLDKIFEPPFESQISLQSSVGQQAVRCKTILFVTIGWQCKPSRMVLSSGCPCLKKNLTLDLFDIKNRSNKFWKHRFPHKLG